MQYELQKLERMSLDEVREIAQNMGLNPRRSQSIREISYAILDAQADNRAEQVQAKEDARAAAGIPAKRERTRGVKRQAKKVNTDNLKSEQVVATVGTELEQLSEMQEQLKANNHKPNKTVQQVEARKPLSQVEAALEQPKEEAPATPAPVAAETDEPAAEAPKKRGRKKKEAEPELVTTETPAAPAEQEIPFAEPQNELPNLGENVIAMGTLECAPDGYGFLRSADYNYLPSPDDVYVSKDQVRQYGLKPGDTVECSIRVNPQPDKFFPMDKVIRINGLAPEMAKHRVALRT